MAITPVGGSSATRITGLSSGIDTDSLVSKMLQTEQSKIDRIFKDNTKLGWKKEAYQNVNSKLSSIKSKYITSTGADSVWSYSTYKAFNVKMEDNKYVNVKATSGAVASSHSITSVTMAKAAALEGAKHRNRAASSQSAMGLFNMATTTGSDEIVAASGLDTKLKDLKAADGTTPLFDSSTDKVSFSINGKTFVFTVNDLDTPGSASEQTLGQMINTVNGTSTANAKMEFTAEGKIKISNAKSGANAQLNLKNVSGPKVFGTDGVFGINSGVTVAKNVLDPAEIGNLSLQQIAEMTGQDFDFYGTKMEFSINGKEFEFRRTDSLQHVLDTINADTDANVTISYDVANNKGGFTIKSNDPGLDSKLELKNIRGNFFAQENEDSLTGIAQGTQEGYSTINRATDTIMTAAQKMGVAASLSDTSFMFKINGQLFSFDPTTTTLQSMMDKVNNSEAGVTMSYSQITDSFTIVSKETGKDSKIEVENVGSARAFGANSFFGNTDMAVSGNNAVLEIDGELIERTSNTFVLDGIEFTLKADFTAATPADNIDFSLEQDIDGVVDKVKAFISEYNKMVQDLNALMREEVDFDYEPLTSEELSSLSEKEIDNWETEAKKGILRNDSTVSKLLSDMRAALFEKVESTGLSAHDIGLTTGSWEKYGQIEFDETKFREALKNDADAVAKTMANVPSGTAGTETYYKQSGLLTRFYDQMTAAESTIKNDRITSTDETISNNEDRMKDLLSRMYELEERYYLQFAQMETILTQYQQQSEWLTQQLASLSS